MNHLILQRQPLLPFAQDPDRLLFTPEQADPELFFECVEDSGPAGHAAVFAFDAHAEELPEPERSTDWEKFKATSPGFASYEEKTDRAFPIFQISKR